MSKRRIPNAKASPVSMPPATSTPQSPSLVRDAAQPISAVSASPFGGMFIVLGLLAAVAAAGLWALKPPRPIEPPPMPEVNLSAADPALRTAYQASLDQIRRVPNSADAWGKLGMVLLANSYFAESTTPLKHAHELDPTDPRWAYFTAQSMAGSDPVNAIQYMQKVIEIDPALSPAPSQRLAELLIGQGDMDRARKVAEAADARWPDDPWTLLTLGRLASIQKRLPEALDYLTRAAAVAPKSAQIHGELARVRQLMGDAETAHNEQVTADALTNADWPDPFSAELDTTRVGLSASLSRCNALIQSGDPAAARIALRVLLKQYPDSVDAWRSLGIASQLVGDLSEAEAAIREAIRIEPNKPALKAMHAFALFRLGKVEEAERVALDATSGVNAPGDAYFSLGLIQQQLGRHPDAIAALQKALRLGFDSAELRYALGVCLAKSGQTEEAITHLEIAVRQTPEDTDAKTLLDTLIAARAAGDDAPALK